MSSAHAERIEQLLDSASGAQSGEVKPLLAKLMSDVKARRQRGSQESINFFLSTTRSLAKIKGTAHSQLRLACLWECANYFETNGHFSHALEVAAQLVRLSKLADDVSWLRKAHTLAGIIQGEQGNIAAALVSHERALTLIPPQEIHTQIATLINIGVVLNYGALYREAIPCFNKGAALAASDIGLRSFYCTALGNLAQSHLYLEDFQQGYEAARIAITDSEPSDARSARSRAIREWTFVQLALELGKLAEAREHSLACHRYAQWGENRRSQILAAITHGLCEVYGGDVEKGLLALERALDRAHEAAAKEDVLRALVKAYDAADRPGEALFHLKSLMAQMRQQSTEGFAAALELTSGVVDLGSVAVESGLLPLQHKEARLRTKIAENEIVGSHVELLERLAVTADLKEEASGAHGYRVGKLAALLAKTALGWTSERCTALEQAGRLHDIGKIGVPDRILLTSETLKNAEREMMCAHTLIGAELLGRSDIPQLRLAEEIARSHHEWWNGQGYPAGLSERRIPVHARLVAIADFFDASTHGRPYASPWPIERALSEIRSRSGTQFDPALVAPFETLIGDLLKKHRDLDEFLGREARCSDFEQARQRIRLLVEERKGAT